MDSHSSPPLRSSKSSQSSPFQPWTQRNGDHHLGPRRLSPCLEGIALSEGYSLSNKPVSLSSFWWGVSAIELTGVPCPVRWFVLVIVMYICWSVYSKIKTYVLSTLRFCHCINTVADSIMYGTSKVCISKCFRCEVAFHWLSTAIYNISYQGLETRTMLVGLRWLTYSPHILMRQ